MKSQYAGLDNRALCLLGLICAGIVALYWPVLVRLFEQWGTDDNYSHGYFIPLIAGAMVYTLRTELLAVKIRPSMLGAILLLGGLALLVVAKIGSEFFLQRLSLIVVLQGCLLFLGGVRVWQLLFLPTAYLIFMIPLPAIIWNKIAFPLQLFGSYLTEQVVYSIGIPVYREGNVLHLAETVLEVVAACSGLRSLVTMFALAGAFAFFSTLQRWKKWVLFFSAAPIAVFANIVRLTLTAILASKYGSVVAHGFLHDFSGLLIFALGLGLLMLMNRILS